MFTKAAKSAGITEDQITDFGLIEQQEDEIERATKVSVGNATDLKNAVLVDSPAEVVTLTGGIDLTGTDVYVAKEGITINGANKPVINPALHAFYVLAEGVTLQNLDVTSVNVGVYVEAANILHRVHKQF